SSVNFVTAHDGFTLMDTVSYNEKQNAANGEDNRDGHDHNCSDNCGVDGPTQDPAILALRAQRRRNMLATLMLSQGTPMILAGDELGNSQSGNNNAYCQDNEIGWVNWNEADPDFLAFVSQIIAFRKATPILRQKRFLHARTRIVDGMPDLFWRRADGEAMTDADWERPELKFLGVEMRMARGTPAYERRLGAIYIMFNAGDATIAKLVDALPGHRWRRVIDTAGQAAPPQPAGSASVAANSVVAFELCPIEKANAAEIARHDKKAKA
ncbi:MAG: glycogen debranching enzyme GlgX, partial [Pseudomonadota bacterium]